MAPATEAELRHGTAGHELLFPAKPTASVLAKADLDPQFGLAEIAFGQPDPAAMSASRNLKWAHISSSGITRYDTSPFRAAMAERKIPLTNSASVYDEACAVHVFSFLLAQARNLPAALQSQAAGGSAAWNALRQSSSTLRGESVLILGYGAIGRRLAELLAPLQMRVTGFRRKPRGDEEIPMIAAKELSPVLAAADHVVNILPESDETRNFFDADRLKMLKPGAVFYNIGRGKTVNQDALWRALRSRHLQSAWLDVTDPEPLPADHPLRREPNCFITPHIAGGHAGETVSLVRHFLENFRRFVGGKPLLNRVM